MSSNKNKLLAHFIARIAVPPGGGIANAVEFFANEDTRRDVILQAKNEMESAINLILLAPDNPFGSDDEAIAGWLVSEIEKKKAERKGKIK